MMLGILCGLSSEAKIADRVAGARVACSAAVPNKARALARGLVDGGATHLMSFGVAGALDPALPVGTLIVGTRVVTGQGNWGCDAAWGDQLAQRLPKAQRGAVWGSEVLVPTAAEKIGLHTSTGCAIVDMESQCAAEVAAEAKLPLAVVRVVCDEATHNVPAFTLYATNPDGSINLMRVITGIIKEPSLLPNLIGIGMSMAKALRVLAAAGNAL